MPHIVVHSRELSGICNVSCFGCKCLLSGTEVALFLPINCRRLQIKGMDLPVSTSIYVIQVNYKRVLASEVSEATAAELFSAGYSILLADEDDLLRLAIRHKKPLSILSNEHRDILRSRVLKLSIDRVTGRLARGPVVSRQPMREFSGASHIPTVQDTELVAERF